MARILIIEDNPTNLELMNYLLEAFGHKTVSAESGEVGLELARNGSVDLIVCDLQLPGIDGYEVVRRMKSLPEARSIPVVAVTAFAMVGDRDRALAAGFDGYLAKPIIPETFVRQVEGFLKSEHRLHYQPPPAEQSRPSTVSSPARATILVVDDSAVNLNLICSTLEPFGYRVITARSVTEAISLLGQSPPEIILSDLHMPEQDGFGLIRFVKGNSHLNGIPFLFISSSIWGEKDRIQALELGATKFISRPIEPQMLLAEVEACLPPGPEDAMDE
jgi:two-component system cell cycle response regulator